MIPWLTGVDKMFLNKLSSLWFLEEMVGWAMDRCILGLYSVSLVGITFVQDWGPSFLQTCVFETTAFSPFFAFSNNLCKSVVRDVDM